MHCETRSKPLIFIHTVFQTRWPLRTWAFAMAFFSSSVNGDLHSHGNRRERKLCWTHGKSWSWGTRSYRNGGVVGAGLDVAWPRMSVWQAFVDEGRVIQDGMQGCRAWLGWQELSPGLGQGRSGGPSLRLVEPQWSHLARRVFLPSLWRSPRDPWQLVPV